ncbi:MAG: hypothetical protein A2504_07475 [Bdellovibrionales bacterium RIFOXYD12_FULL_39_22]|nr:MAG: hypothetical protein A2385_16845 [Bdellovibrionales bacterium RIFOXYB1_FULL_39_21]OFZ44716.1 MAG: hypothetical protein A2485_14705 [Bdellovibrionales bacterium RIFOXYC12_FULL_39_17]OFZ49346.1 MAG: hypothetical protein A2404_09000 [Bdellovibrionales bacterium RIFOXYC1_FULL_39_130]OFZ71513.1 MAG: hypothetical protein A2451_00155 [Bdellovibrionales bacterium RIFOXYC2_FULL_39_8]OFZ77082.1 MAG: hypothetical protein A2560_09965 [Bdellovibrionales bacterium RIFOXYD1_FULL_39_84]OFZ95342.1 MAG:
MSENILELDYKVCASRYSESSESQDNGQLFNKQIWRAEDVAKFLKCSVGHIYNLASDEKIPKRKIGGILFFVPREILNWILGGGKV